jgi:hypothetical protein
MKKYFLFSVSLIFSVLLLPMDKKQQQDSFLVTLFSPDIAQKIETYLSLPDIDRVRRMHKATYCYWNVSKVASLAQIQDNDDTRNYAIREAILASCSNPDLFTTIWKIDAGLRDVDFLLFCARKNSQKKVGSRCDDSIDCRIRQYKKYYGSVEKTEKRRWQALCYVVNPWGSSRSREMRHYRYKKHGKNLKTLLNATGFNIFDTAYFCKKKKEKSALKGFFSGDIRGDVFESVIDLNNFDLLWIIMGCRLDPRAFEYLFPKQKDNFCMFHEKLVCQLFRKEHSAFSAIDSHGRMILHYLCRSDRPGLVKEYISQAIAQKQIVNIALRDKRGCTPFAYLSREGLMYTDSNAKTIQSILMNYVSNLSTQG